MNSKQSGLREIWTLLVLLLIFHWNALAALLGCAPGALLKSQSITHQTEAWAGYISSVRISNRIGIWNDFHYVGTSFFASRHGLTLYLPRKLELTAGYAYVLTATSFTDKLVRNEHRPWAQLVGGVRISSRWNYRYRFRYDARFRQAVEQGQLREDRIFYHRIRFMNDVRYTLKTFSAGNSLQLVLMNEALFNAGAQVLSGLDQNRLYLLLGFRYPKLTILTGYHQRAIPNTSSVNWTLRHGVTVWLIHRMDFREE